MSPSTDASKRILICEEVMAHCHPPGQECWGLDFSDTGCSKTSAEFAVDLETGECEGRVLGQIVQVDPDFWKAYCAGVGARVQASYRWKDPSYRARYYGHAGVAQLVERDLPKIEVAGSNPAARSILLSDEEWCIIENALSTEWLRCKEAEKDITHGYRDTEKVRALCKRFSGY